MQKETDPQLHPLLQRIYLARGIESPQQLQYDLTNLPSYKELLNIDAAVECLYEALLQQQKIVIVGDYDADGATSTALAVKALRAFGFEHVAYLVPDRFKYGYGLTPEIVKVAAEMQPNLIVTVDNGVASIDGVAAAKKLGIKVLVTDHHLAGGELPNAVAIVNPNQPNDSFSGKNLAGVGVIFYVMLALRSWLRAQHWFEDNNMSEPNMADFLDLVALGTVADVVSLDYINRILVHQGLKRIRSGKSCSGILALLQVAKRKYRSVVASDLGFGVGPRLNAAGRLEDMSLGVECLLAETQSDAYILANELNDLNQERKGIEDEMRKQALQILDSFCLEKQLPVGVCLYDANWHQGVVGLVASRIKDKIHRPVIAFARVSENEIKGSARSINGVHIRDVLENIAIKHPELITKFGGHAMAAGLSLELSNYQSFCEVFANEVQDLVSEADLSGEIHTDGELCAADFELSVAEMLRNAGPWGQGFVEPIFVGEFEILDQRLVGEKHLRLTLGVSGSDKTVNAIAFGIDTNIWPNYRCSKLNAIYRLDVNEYNGFKNLQLVIERLC